MNLRKEHLLCFILLLFSCKQKEEEEILKLSALVERNKVNWCVEYKAMDKSVTKDDLENFRKVSIDQDKKDILIEDKHLNIESKPSYTLGERCNKQNFVGSCSLKGESKKVLQVIYLQKNNKVFCEKESGEWNKL
jgi:hypothetical protein